MTSSSACHYDHVIRYKAIEWDETKRDEALATKDMADFLIRTRNRYPR